MIIARPRKKHHILVEVKEILIRDILISYDLNNLLAQLKQLSHSVLSVVELGYDVKLERKIC